MIITISSSGSSLNTRADTDLRRAPLSCAGKDRPLPPERPLSRFEALTFALFAVDLGGPGPFYFLLARRNQGRIKWLANTLLPPAAALLFVASAFTIPTPLASCLGLMIAGPVFEMIRTFRQIRNLSRDGSVQELALTSCGLAQVVFDLHGDSARRVLSWLLMCLAYAALGQSGFSALLLLVVIRPVLSRVLWRAGVLGAVAALGLSKLRPRRISWRGVLLRVSGAAIGMFALFVLPAWVASIAFHRRPETASFAALAALLPGLGMILWLALRLRREGLDITVGQILRADADTARYLINSCMDL